VAKIGDVGMVRPQVSDLVTAQPLMTPLWAAPEVLRRERAGVKVGAWLFREWPGRDNGAYVPVGELWQRQQ
jgi:hypothetical protein